MSLYYVSLNNTHLKEAGADRTDPLASSEGIGIDHEDVVVPEFITS